MFSIKNYITLGAIAIAASAIAYGAWRFYDLNRDLEVAVLEKNNALAAVSILEKANAENIKTIEMLITEKQFADSIAAQLKEELAKDKKQIRQLQKTIKNHSANPANQVGISPVMQDVINQIQEQRKLRSKK